MHEDYNWESDENDIAILALSRPLELNRYVGNISLPEKNTEFSGSKKLDWMEFKYIILRNNCVTF